MPFTKPVIVIDNGSYNIKAGFACDNHPVSIFRTVVGRPKYLNGTYGKGHYEVYIGEDAVARKHELDLNFPVTLGKITHWDNMERVWHHIFYKELKAAPEERAVLLSCAPLTTLEDKIKCCEIFFETLNAPALCVKPQSLLALYGSGHATGMSVDLGQDITEINPMYEGGSISYANMLTGVAGHEISEYMRVSLKKRGVDFGDDIIDIMADIRKDYMYITENATGPRNRAKWERKYKLPSGEEIDLSEELFMAGEMYFQPDLVLGRKTNYLSLQEAFATSLAKCDVELQTDLIAAVVTHGGMSGMPGLNKRFAKEVEALINKPIHVLDSSECYAVAWLGGATFAGISSAKNIYIHKKQFEDHGARIVRNMF